MKIMRHMPIIVLAAFLPLLCDGVSGAQDVGLARNPGSGRSLISQDVGLVRNLKSASHSPGDLPSPDHMISVQWEQAEGDPRLYFVRFDTDPDYTFDDLNTVGAYRIRWPLRYLWTPMESEPDDVAYYFHIAAGDKEWTPGLTTTMGPFRIDMVPPYDVGVTAPEITPTRTVTLTLGSTNACLVQISNEGHDSTRQGQEEWDFLADMANHGWDLLVGQEEHGTTGCRGERTHTREWELPPGGGERTVHVRFADLAGNFADTSVTIRHLVGDLDADLTVGLRDAVLALRVHAR